MPAQALTAGVTPKLPVLCLQHLGFLVSPKNFRFYTLLAPAAARHKRYPAAHGPQQHPGRSCRGRNARNQVRCCRARSASEHLPQPQDPNKAEPGLQAQNPDLCSAPPAHSGRAQAAVAEHEAGQDTKRCSIQTAAAELWQKRTAVLTALPGKQEQEKDTAGGKIAVLQAL